MLMQRGHPWRKLGQPEEILRAASVEKRMRKRNQKHRSLRRRQRMLGRSKQTLLSGNVTLLRELERWEIFRGRGYQKLGCPGYRGI